ATRNYVDVMPARQTSACIDLAPIMAYTIRATAIAAKRVGRPPAYQRMAIQPPPAAMASRAPPARRGHSNRPAPCEAKYRASPSPKQPYARPTLLRHALTPTSDST